MIDRGNSSLVRVKMSTRAFGTKLLGDARSTSAVALGALLVCRLPHSCLFKARVVLQVRAHGNGGGRAAAVGANADDCGGMPGNAGRATRRRAALQGTPASAESATYEARTITERRAKIVAPQNGKNCRECPAKPPEL